MRGLRARRASCPDYNISYTCGRAAHRSPTQIANGPKIFIATNDCSDGTDALIAEIGTAFPVYHVDNQETLPGETIQTSAVRRCMLHPEAQDQTWALHIDIDEFLDLEDSRQTVNPFLDGFADADIVVICWKIFGDADYQFWQGGSILDTFLMASDSPLKGFGVKTFYRVARFGGAHPHRPKDPTVPIPSLRAVTTEKVALDTEPLGVKWMTAMRVPEDARTWSGACINHYMHRSQDLTTATRLFRGDANGRDGASKRRMVGHKKYNEYNLNLVEDRAIRKSHAARQRVMNEILALPRVRKLHYDGMTHHFERVLSIFDTSD